MTVKSSLSCYVNETYEITDVVTSDGTATGTPTNITGWALQCVIHRRAGDGVPLKTYTTGGHGITIPTGTDGKNVTLIPVADIATLGVGRFAVYIARTDAGLEKNLSEIALFIQPV